MNKTVDFPIVGSYNNQRITNIDPERAINCFEYRDPLGKKNKTQLFTSGLIDTDLSFTGQSTGFRGQYVLLGFQYLVVGTGVYRLDSNNNLALLGNLQNTTTGYVGIDANSFQIMFVDGVNGYIWDTVHNVFTQISDTSFPGQPIDVCTLDNFFVVPNGNTPNFQLSSYDNGLVWGPDGQTFTADDTGGNNWLILSNTANYQTGTSFQVSNSGGSLPTPLVDTATYYAIYVSTTEIRVASTLEDAYAGTPITLSSNGSGTNTITSLGQLQQASITTHPGNIVACRTLHRRLFLFSEYYTEVWENAGIGVNLPFRRNNSLLMEYGTAAIGSVAADFDVMFFISQARNGLGSVMMVHGTESIIASTHALDYQLAQYYAAAQISDCRSFLIKENGIIFYRMNFTAADHTFVYNVSHSDPGSDLTKFWHEEEVLDGSRHLAQTGGCFNGKNYVGDYSKPVLYQLDINTYTNAGEAIKRTRITRALCPPGYQRLRVDRLQVDLMQGQNPPNFIASGMNLYLSISRDGGYTYGYENIAPLGEIGNRAWRTVYRKLGTIPRGQPWVIKTEFYAPYPLVILGASWAVAELPE